MDARTLQMYTPPTFLLFAMITKTQVIISSSNAQSPAAADVSNTSASRANNTALPRMAVTKTSNLVENISKPSELEFIHDGDVSRCLGRHARLMSRFTSLRLESARWAAKRGNGPLSCTLILAPPGVRTIHTALWRRGVMANCSLKNYVTVRGYGHSFKSTDCQRSSTHWANSTNAVEIVIAVGEPRVLLDLTISVQAMDPNFMTKYFSANMGYIKNSFPKSEQPSFPVTDNWITIPVPIDHVALISLLKFHNRFSWSRLFYRGSLRLYKESHSGRNMAWTANDEQNVPAPEVFNASMIYLRFVGKTSYLFFKLLYSFHEYTHQPSRGHGGLWNCSLPEWPEFERHFRCNLKRECEGREDEAQCVYTGYCGDDHLTILNRCYAFLHMQDVSWRNANQECQRRGGYLASFNTQDEWQAVTKVLLMRRSRRQFYFGLHQSSFNLPIMYRDSLQWADKTVAFLSTRCWLNSCGYFQSYSYQKVFCTYCDVKSEVHFLCELDSLSKNHENNEGSRDTPLYSHMTELRNYTLRVPSVRCPAGHLVHVFMACDEQSACWSNRRGYSKSETLGIPFKASCFAPMTSLPAMFKCSSSLHSVPYSLVCDHRQQCGDGSDESFCVFPPCAGTSKLKCTSSAQCIEVKSLCDHRGDCLHDTDEARCDFLVNTDVLPPPAVIHFTPNYSNTVGSFYTRKLHSACPETHFQCRGNGYCLPVFLMCNGINDCPSSEDEEEAYCDGTSCVGFYRCRSSRICLHPWYVCDGQYQCPEHDDELVCRQICPVGCTCLGMDFRCHRYIQVELPADVRYLDASESGLTPARLKNNTFLIHLNLSYCGLGSLGNMTFPNVRSLDLSGNGLYAISVHQLRWMANLQYLSLSKNPLKTLFPPETEQTSFLSLRGLDLSVVKLQNIDTRSFVHFPGLRSLNLSHCDIDQVTGEGLHAMNKLRVLDFEGCQMSQFPRDLLSGLDELQAVSADNFKLCCPEVLPAGFNLANCRALFDEVSSCESLLRSDVYIFFLSSLACLALLGNLCCMFMRCYSSKKSASGFTVFVIHLSISDFLMGVYLAIIGVADRLFKGSYLWEDLVWRHSMACSAAGFMSLLSSEASAFIICLISLDRFLVLHFPFSSLHFKARSAHVICAVVWCVVLVMAAVPLTPMTSRWSFYSQTGICIPLPVNRGNFAGHHYSFGIFIICNFILFLLIAGGQAAIYVSIQNNSLPMADSTKKSTDLKIARRLMSVAVSDFLCWFPIGLLGVLASRGVPIPGEINVGMAILVLPLNSAINPFLYTINVIQERRRKLHEEKLLKQLINYY